MLCYHVMETVLKRSHRWTFANGLFHSVYFLLAVFYLFVEVPVKSTLSRVAMFSSILVNAPYLSFLSCYLCDGRVSVFCILCVFGFVY